VLDLLVVGGGPVGLATALYAERAGLSVTVLERRGTPIDKACGEGLMPGAVAALHELGVDPSGRAFEGIRYVSGPRSAEARFASGPGLGVRRTTLHATLARAVAERGITVCQDAVDDIDQQADHVAAGGLQARYLVAADGLHSTVRRLAGLEPPTRPGTSRGSRFGLRRHVEVEPWTDLVEVHWGRDREAYVTPVSDRLVGVALLTTRREPFAAQLAGFPDLVERLDAHALSRSGFDSSGATLGAGPLRQRSTARVAGRVLLVGDAAGYVDALTGEGIAVGLACARAAVEAVKCDDPASYEKAWWKVSRRYRWITETLLWTRNHRATARLIVPGAQRLPGVFPAAVRQLAR
jgi:flavin-dependent dehydrogenase